MGYTACTTKCCRGRCDQRRAVAGKFFPRKTPPPFTSLFGYLLPNLAPAPNSSVLVSQRLLPGNRRLPHCSWRRTLTFELSMRSTTQTCEGISKEIFSLEEMRSFWPPGDDIAYLNRRQGMPSHSEKRSFKGCATTGRDSPACAVFRIRQRKSMTEGLGVRHVVRQCI